MVKIVFKEVGTELPEIWSPEKKDDSIEGIYVKTKSNVGINKANLYILDVDGVIRSMWGSTVLDDKMVHVSEGDKIKITYLGKDKEKNYHKYKVEKDEPEED